jgi:LuxR family maltose regulon positive regulatory protein
MPTPILATKLYRPPPRINAVVRPRLFARLDEGLRLKLAVVSAPAGFGKTTLVSAWAAECGYPVGWLSLDPADNDPARFMSYLAAALQAIIPTLDPGVLGMLESPQPLHIETVLTALLNEIDAIPDDVVLVLDDYHSIDADAVDQILAFLLEHLPAQLHLVIVTREDPRLPLARMRARGQLYELRAADLRFTIAEAAAFLNDMMGLTLSKTDIATLETRTEGWIAGLQLAALSLQSRSDPADFIQSFSGSHRYILDYLLEEVLQRQPQPIQRFLLQTSILERMCGPLCDALVKEEEKGIKQEYRMTNADPTLTLPPSSFILTQLEQANLFIMPLDDERRWYRYHRLFADLLRLRLQQQHPELVAELHVRASQWYEANDLELEAFQHVAAAGDIARAERLIDGKEMPLHVRGAVTTILSWLGTLPVEILDARPSLWVRSATLALVSGQTTGVEEKLQAAEAALRTIDPHEQQRDLVGQIAAARATLALSRYESNAIIEQSRRALAYLDPTNLNFRFTAVWTLAFAYQLQGDRAAAAQAYHEAVALSQKSGDTFSTILAMSGLGQVQELENQLYAAAESYQRVLQLFGDHPQPNASEAHLGLARIAYAWNDLATAEQHGQQSLKLARQYDRHVDRYVIAEVFLARLKLAQGDLTGAHVILDQTEQSAQRQNFVQRLPEIAAARIELLLQQGNADAAAQLAHDHTLPLSQARVCLARNDPAGAAAILEPLHRETHRQNWIDQRLRILVLLASTYQTQADTDSALALLHEALTLAEPGGCIRLFVDEGAPIKQLLQELVVRGAAGEYPQRILAAFAQAEAHQATRSVVVEPLSDRELEVLQLIAAGLTNREIADQLYLSLNTVKVHTRNIYGKLDVTHRTQAVARARGLGLLPAS